MNSKEIIEIYKEARKAGLYVALMMTAIIIAILIVFGGLFGYYIYKSYNGEVASISATQDGFNNMQEVNNG